jgi:hypothetical protein
LLVLGGNKDIHSKQNVDTAAAASIGLGLYVVVRFLIAVAVPLTT